MRIFVAGATGVLGSRLLPLLIADGHQVAGMTRTASKRELLVTLGAEPILCDVFDAEALTDAVVGYLPDVVIHQLTDLPDDFALVREFSDANSRMREEGTRNLLAAAQSAGSPQFLAQSIAWETGGSGARARNYLESAVLAINGVVLRYGRFYGPGTYYENTVPDRPRIHVHEAARQSLPALNLPSGIIDVVER